LFVSLRRDSPRFDVTRGVNSARDHTGAPGARTTFNEEQGRPCPTTRSLTLTTFELQSGHTLYDAKIAYKTHGTLNAAKDNVVIFPTWYSAFHMDNEWMIGEDMALDPRKYFIIIPNMLGNGLSSSPSNTPEPYDGARFPPVTIYDQVKLQHRLVTEKFGIEKIKLVTGWSMGAAQSFQLWAGPAARVIISYSSKA
jgi:homoserine acetyltransferase